MLSSRTNQDWLFALADEGPQQEEALEDLRRLLYRAALYTLASNINDLQDMAENDRFALAEECAQEALITVLAHVNEFRGESKFTTWVYKFGVNIALSRSRKWHWRQVSLDALSDDEGTLDWLQHNENFQLADSEESLRKKEILTLIRDSIITILTTRQRQILIMIAFDNVPMDVVVQHFSTNRNSVYKTLHDARLKLKQNLVQHGYDLSEVLDLFQ